MNDVHQINGQYLQLSTANNPPKKQNKDGSVAEVNTNMDIMGGNTNNGAEEKMDTGKPQPPTCKVPKEMAKNWNMTHFLMDNMQTMSAQQKEKAAQNQNQQNGNTQNQQPHQQPQHQHNNQHKQQQHHQHNQHSHQNNRYVQFNNQNNQNQQNKMNLGAGLGNGNGNNGGGNSGGSFGGGNFNTPYGAAYGYPNFTSFGANPVWGNPK